MDCSVCSSLPFILRPPRNTICGACYEGAKSVIALMNKLESDKTIDNKASNSLPSSPNPWMTGMKDRESELNEKISFLSGSIALLKDQILTDIQLKPGNDGPSISAHRAYCDTIMLPELDHQELESLLEFLYSGSLPSEKLEKHVYSLTLAADKYDIPYLLKFCERHMLRFLNSSNALDVLEISDACSNKTLKETALNFIVKNMRM
ncbi:BTB/POZ domain-containing protein [Salix suchowensis]|nr:BTB/POZ domain-containing protein [Salix suchowensis]